jgi:membrane fusion protein (multidrug efflux system)
VASASGAWITGAATTAGTVVGIGADDTDFVKPGQILVQFDRADAKVALERAEAQLARAVRQVRNVFAVDSQLEAMVEERRIEVNRSNDDVVRRERVAASGAVSQEEIEHARGAATTLDLTNAVANCLRIQGDVCVETNSITFKPDQPGTYKIHVAADLAAGTDPLGPSASASDLTVEVGGHAASGCSAVGGTGAALAAILAAMGFGLRRRRGA